MDISIITSAFYRSEKNVSKMFKNGGPEMKCTYFNRNCWKKYSKMIIQMSWISQ